MVVLSIRRLTLVVRALNDKFTWKLTDFGYVSEGSYKNPALTQNTRGTFVYQPSEIALLTQENVPVITNKADIWALGCVLYELATGRKAFSEQTLFAYSFGLAPRPRVSTTFANSAPTYTAIVELRKMWTAAQSLPDLQESVLYDPAPLDASHDEVVYINNALKAMLNKGDAKKRPTANSVILYCAINILRSTLSQNSV